MRWDVLRSSPKTTIERAIGATALVLAALGPLVFNQYWAHQILIETFMLGISPAILKLHTANSGMV